MLAAGFSGTHVAIVTPMQAGGEIDWDAWTRLVDFHLAHGTDGIVVGGTTGESPTITDAELLDLPIMPDEQRLRRFLASMPSALLVRYRDDASVAERVRGILRRNLKRSLSLEDVAAMLALIILTVSLVDILTGALRHRLLEAEARA